MRQDIDNFRSTVQNAYARLSGIADHAAAVPPAPDKWSAKQVIGHLIDSASNNHQRFVRAQFKMENTSDDIRIAPRAKHNLYQTALFPVPAEEPATLEYFMLDYIKHLEQHLAQIRA